MDSILNSVKKKMGITSSYDYFDDGDIIDHINSAFMVLHQLGVGPDTPYHITDDTDEWCDFSPNIDNLEMVKSYVARKVRLAFDPPQSSAHIELMKAQIAEDEWRLNAAVEPKEEIQNEG